MSFDVHVQGKPRGVLIESPCTWHVWVENDMFTGGHIYVHAEGDTNFKQRFDSLDDAVSFAQNLAYQIQNGYIPS